MDHTLMSIGPCRLAIVPHKALTKVSQDYPHLTRMLWFSTLMDSAIHREWAMRLGGLQALPRMAHLICELYLRLEIVGHAKRYRFEIPISQRQLSEALGLSTVHTSRVLNRLRADGFVSLSNGVFQIHDWKGLTAIADFDPTYLHMDKLPR